jgi:hypothetical protein
MLQRQTKARLSLHPFSQNSKLINGIMCRCSTQYFTQTDQQLWKLKMDIHCGDFHEERLAVSANNLCTKFHENPTLCLVFNTRSTAQRPANRTP